MNKFLKWSNYCADYTVFISSWLKELDIYQKNKESKVILNGSDPEIFNDDKNHSWDGTSPFGKLLRIIGVPILMKGFDVYQEIDKLLTNSEWSKIEFTYIGNLPDGFSFKKTKHIKPISGKKLSLELSKHHFIYICLNK